MWRDLHRALADDAEFDERERLLIAAAGRQADNIDRLERELDGAALMIEGSTGQARLHPAIGELRLGRLALARLLAGFDFQTAEPSQASEASRRARTAADARWRRRDELAARRREVADAP